MAYLVRVMQLVLEGMAKVGMVLLEYLKAL